MWEKTWSSVLPAYDKFNAISARGREEWKHNMFGEVKRKER